MFTIKVYGGYGYTAYSTPAYTLRSYPDKARVEIVLFDLKTGEHYEVPVQVPETSEESMTVFVENIGGKTIDRIEVYHNQVIRKVKK
jgi:hypothetical protein